MHLGYFDCAREFVLCFAGKGSQDPRSVQEEDQQASKIEYPESYLLNARTTSGGSCWKGAIVSSMVFPKARMKWTFFWGFWRMIDSVFLLCVKLRCMVCFPRNVDIALAGFWLVSHLKLDDDGDLMHVHT